MTAEFPTAVHALVYLAHTARITPSGELAENICTNPARVRKILAKLAHAGLVQVFEGRASGYHCQENGRDITLCQVAQALGEVPVGVSWRPGDVDKNCLVSSGMADAMDGVYEALNEVCFGKLAEITIGQISDTLLLPPPAATT
ncbi:MAG: Rrf2 family transcriptional regulator [Gemmiger sp.]|nr:Rrf2 family transcriptional regulator [Gemmiger sp.]